MVDETKKLLVIIFNIIIPFLGVMMLMKPFSLPVYLFLGGLGVVLILIATSTSNSDGTITFRQII